MIFFRIQRRHFLIGWSIIASFVLVVLTSPASSKNTKVVLGDTTLASQLNLRAIELAQAKKYDSAIATFQQAAFQYQEAEVWDRFFYAQHTIGYLLNTQYKYQETFQYLDSIDIAYSSKLKMQFDSYQSFYGTLAWCQFKIFNYNKAFYYFKLVDLGAKENPNVKPEQILFSKYYQGVIYQRIGQYDKALKLMLLTLELGDRYSSSTYLGNSYNNLGIIYRKLGEYERALEFYKKAFVEEKKYNPEVSLTPLYNNLGSIYYHLKDYTAALKELNYGIKVLTDYTSDYYPVESALINTKALVLIEIDSISEAKAILNNILARELDKYNEYGPYSGSTLLGLGKLSSRAKNYALANNFFEQFIEVFIINIGNKTDKLAEAYNSIGKNLLAIENYIEALTHVQKGIISLVIEFNTIDFNTNPSLNSTILNKVLLIESQYLKAKILLALFSERDELNYLHAAEKSNQVALELVDIVRENMLYESSKMNLSDRAKSIYEQSIKIALLLEKETSMPAAARVFEAMESSKAYLLSENIERARVLGFSNIPQTILLKEDSFRTELKILEVQRSNILLRSKDSIALAEVNRELFEIKEQFEEYKQTSAGDNKVYQHRRLDLDKYKVRLLASELVIEYFAGEDELFAITLSNTGVKIYQLGAYNEPINSFVNSVRKIQQINAAEYQTEAYKIYNILLSSILADNKQAKSLVIIPDKQLGYIPFDALVTKIIEDPGYKKLPYLIKDYVVLHHQTVNLYVDRNYPQERTVEEFIGFAPDFNENELLIASNNQLRNSLQPLPYAKKEVITISQLLGGVEETGPRANENNLKAKASSFNILHLATHAIIDEENPLYSKLLFNLTDSTFDDDDGELHSFEIYGMKLNASLVTLSACNTGTGKYLAGEGIFSLGRSFLLAGAKSVLTSLWEVSDLSTSQIMESFYTNLKKGETTPAALRQAKLSYLQSADPLTANPHYWAAFVYIGQPNSIYPSSKVYYWLAGFGLFFLTIAIVVRRNREK